MSSRQTSPMHEHFADWHRRGAFEVSGDQLDARWRGMQTFLKGASTLADRLELVRLGFRHDPDSEFARSFAAALQTADSLFPMEDNELLLSVLACVGLIDGFERMTGDLQTVAALAVTSTRTLDWSPALAEVPSRAIDYLVAEGQRIRSPATRNVTGVATQMKKAVDTVTAGTSEGSVPAAELGEALIAISGAVTSLYDSAVAVAGATNQGLREQLTILWWLYGERSYDLDASFGEIDASAAPVVLGKELADLTEVAPGPRATRAFLAKALGLSGGQAADATVADAVNAAPREWRATMRLPADERARIFTPIAELVRRSLEGESKSAWIATGASATGLNPKRKTEALEIADQVYREQLLTRLIG